MSGRFSLLPSPQLLRLRSSERQSSSASSMEERGDNENDAERLLSADGEESATYRAATERSAASVETPETTTSLLSTLLFSIVIGALGEYGPKLWLVPRKLPDGFSVPCQQVGDGLVLDFELNEPLVDPPTIPSWLLTFTCVIVPCVIIIASGCFGGGGRLQKTHVVLLGLSSLFLAVGCSEGTVQILKLYVGRKRPNFYQLCGFNGDTLRCEAPLDHILEATWSFPSGHSSLSMCGMTVLMRFLQQQYLTSPRTRWYSYLGVTTLPLLYSVFVAATRLHDHWHHPSDVAFGLVFGFVWGMIGYQAHHAGGGRLRTSSRTSSTSVVSMLPLTRIVSGKAASFHE